MKETLIRGSKVLVCIVGVLSLLLSFLFSFEHLSHHGLHTCKDYILLIWLGGWCLFLLILFLGQDDCDNGLVL